MTKWLQNIFIILTTLALTACVSHYHVMTNDVGATLWQSPTPQFAPNTPKANRIASIALREHRAWGEPFITLDGKIAQYEHYESEKFKLADGSLAWERVVAYWRDGGALARLDRRLNFNQCDKADTSPNASSNHCRVFASDVAWSAAFVSYVMRQAGVDFYVSPRHFDYIRQAWQGQGDYRTADVRTSPVAVGDLLCYVRGNASRTITDYEALGEYLDNHELGVPAHCDIAVKVDDDKGELWLVGGNVVHTVMLRKMPIDRAGVVVLPTNMNKCTPDDESGCNFNRRNWVVVLKLQTS